MSNVDAEYLEHQLEIRRKHMSEEDIKINEIHINSLNAGKELPYDEIVKIVDEIEKYENN